MSWFVHLLKQPPASRSLISSVWFIKTHFGFGVDNICCVRSTWLEPDDGSLHSKEETDCWGADRIFKMQSCFSSHINSGAVNSTVRVYLVLQECLTWMFESLRFLQDRKSLSVWLFYTSYYWICTWGWKGSIWPERGQGDEAATIDFLGKCITNIPHVYATCQ